MRMRKTVALLLVLAFLTASCVMVAKPAFSSATVTEDSLASKAPMHVARFGLGVAVVNGKIYAIGGSTRSGGGGTRNGKLPVTGGVVGTNEVYDPATDTWTTKKPMPTPRQYFATAVYQNKIYCIDGTNEVYDPATDTWETKAPVPTGATGFVSAVVDDKICVFGAFSESGDSMRNQIYDPETDSWSEGAPSPSGVTYGAAGATTGVNAPKRIYVLGEKWDHWEGEPPYFVRVYDPEKDVWTFGADIPTHRYDFGVAVVNDMLYAIGGYTSYYPDSLYSLPYGPSNTPHATNEQYTPIGYGTVPPVVQVVSPASQTYNGSSVSLVFTVNKPVNWTGYSLDGQDNVTITGNTTISGLTNGLHNITVYAKDTFENMGASETVYFSVEVPFPTTLVIASIVSVAVVGVGLLVYFKKKRSGHS
jgi:hypothetical protein